MSVLMPGVQSREKIVRADVINGYVFLKAEFTLNPIIEQIPGWLWDKQQEAYRFKGTPFAVQNILDHFRPLRDNNIKLRGSPDFMVLVAQAKGIADHQAVKNATNLPPIPLTRTKPWDHQLRAYHYGVNMSACYLAMGMGPQPLWSLVLTPNGFTSMGNINVGDKVIGSNGTATEVINVTEFDNSDVYSVTFSDDSVAACGIDHLWHVRTPKQKYRGSPGRVKSLREIMNAGLKDGYGNRKWFVPIASPVHFDVTHPLPVDPWLLGVILGDGSLGDESSLTITKKCPLMLKMISESLPESVELSPYGNDYYGIVGKIRGLNPLLTEIRALGLTGKTSAFKFVPHPYQFASVGDRIAILQGLFDTDGSAQDGDTGIEWTSKSFHMACAVQFIARSLGGLCSKNKKIVDGETYWRCYVRLPPGIEPFRLERKKDRYATRMKYELTRSIESVMQLPSQRVKCITVAAEDGLYLTDEFIVTHNSGKSKVAVDIHANRGHKKTLLLAPLSVIQEWPNQFRMHSGVPVITVPLDDKSGTVANKVKEVKLALHHGEMSDTPVVIVMNYESVWRAPFGPEYKEMKDGKERRISKGYALTVPWDLVICDEIHRIQSAGGKASKMLAELGPVAKQRLGLSGTPFSSGPLSIYGQFRFLDSSIFGTRFDDFKQHYAIVGGFNGGQVLDYQNQEELQKKFYSIAYRVETRDVLDLPDERHERRYCNLSPSCLKAYKEMERDLVARFKDGEVTAKNALVKLLRLQQMTSGYARLDDTFEDEGEVVKVDDAKQKLLSDLMEDIDRKEPVVIFARFTHDLQAVREVCEKQNRRYAELSGKERQIEEWRNGDFDVLGVQIRSGGVGINLTRAHICIYYSMGYSLADFDQSLARTMRPGQKFDVVYYHILAKGTIDEKVYKALEAKSEVVRAILGEMR